MPIRNRKKESEAARVSSDARLASIAEHSLRYFEDSVAKARMELGEPRPLATNTFAVLNSLTNEHAVRNFEQLPQSQINELRQLCNEPAIARVVAEDQSGATKAYFISRATPHRSPSDGSAAVSYRASVGRLASLPVGGELEIALKNGTSGGWFCSEVLWRLHSRFHLAPERAASSVEEAAFRSGTKGNA